MAPTDVRAADEGPLQFGHREPGRDYPDRPAAFGVAVQAGRIALAYITPHGVTPYFDLPGGGIDGDETPAAAMLREFGEETGLVVRAGAVLIRAGQYLIKRDGAPANNRLTVFEAELVGEDASLKVETDHALTWVQPDEALRRLRLDSHAWAVAAWLRRAADNAPTASC